MKRKLLVLLLLSLPMISMAQGKKYNGHGDGMGYGGNPRGNNSQMMGVPGSALSVSSDNGERFYLMLNGIKQNTYAQTRVRIEDLPQVVNDIQIIFDDNRTPAINKTITFMDPVEGNAVNLSMKIVRDRNGYVRLAFSRLTTLERDYRGEQGEYVMHYGHDNGPRQVPTPPTPPPPPAPMPMDSRSFGDALDAIRGSKFDDTKLSTAKTIASTNLFTTDQIMEICRQFSFDASKLTFAKYAYKRTIDNNNYYKVNSVFSFDSDKTALNNYVNANR